MRFVEAGMKVLGLCFGLILLSPVASGIAAQNAPTDARRSEATAVADASIKQSGSAQLAADGRGAPAALPLAAMVTSAPAPAAESGDEMFIGTGDGSNGFWVRP